MGAAYTEGLDEEGHISLMVWFENDRADVTDYAIVLVARDGVRLQTVRVYDGAHGRNEMHRYQQGMGKRQAEIFHRGTLGEGMRTAIDAIKSGYEEMIDGWQRA
jgi:hypothetical protein